MDIITFSTISPPNFGASFTKHTDETLVKCFDYLQETPQKLSTYADLQHLLDARFGIRPSNFRCIIPLAKSFGFVSFTEKNEFAFNTFFTKTGRAYIDVLKQISNLDISQHPNRQKACHHLIGVLENIRLLGLFNCLKHSSSDVATVFYVALSFLCEYDSINKQELPYLWHEFQQDKTNYLDKIRNVLLKFRNGLVSFNPKLIEQRDVDSSNPGNDYHAKAPGYTYVFGTLLQCGVVTNNRNGNYFLVQEKKERIFEILKEVHHE